MVEVMNPNFFLLRFCGAVINFYILFEKKNLQIKETRKKWPGRDVIHTPRGKEAAENAPNLHFTSFYAKSGIITFQEQS